MFLRLANFSFLLLVFSLGYMQPFVTAAGFRIPPTDFIFLPGCLFFFLALLTKQIGFRRHKFYRLLLFYFAAMLISLFFSENFQTSLIKIGGEIYLLSLPIIAFNLIRSDRQFKQVVQAWLGGASIAVVVGLLTIFLFYFDRENILLHSTLFHYGAVPVGNYPRVASTFLSASLLCNYLSVSLILLLTARYFGWLNRFLFYLLLAATMLVTIFTIASNLGGIALAAGLWVYFVYRRKQKILSIISLFTGLTIAVLFYAMNFVALEKHSTANFSWNVFGTEFYPSPRLQIWIDSLKTFTDNFFFGRGVGQDACRVVFQNTDGSFSTLTDAHNTFLSVGAQEGIFGLVAITAIIFYLLRKTFLEKTVEAESGLLKVSLGIAFLSAFVYQGLTGSFEDARHLWVLIGLILVVENNFENAEVDDN